MAVLRGIPSFVMMLLCSDLFCAAEEESQERISVSESEHFCAKVMSGRFEHIQLVNIGPFFVYEPDNRMLSCPRVPTETNEDDSEPKYSFRVFTDEHSMTLNDTYEEWFNEAALIPRWLQAHKQEDGHIRRFYNFLFEVDAFFDALVRKESSIKVMIDAVAKSRKIYLAYTDRSLYTWDLKFESAFRLLDKLVEPVAKVALSHDTAEVALLFKNENDIATGYVIQKDSQTGNFIIYDFSYDGKPAPKGFWSRTYTQIKNIFRSLYESKVVKPEALKLDSKVYYFMEKTDNPHEIRLVHRDHAGANGSGADRQLLGGALPNGFEYDGSLYLFDGSLGCVYVIQHFEFNLTQQFEEGKVDIRLARLNIPYEQYFKCPDKYKLADDFAKRYRADRCDSVIGEDDGSIDRGAHIDQNMSTGIFWALIGLACILFMAMFVVGVIIFWKKIKPRKIGNKKRPIGPNDLERANKSDKTLTTSGTTEASGTTTAAVSSSADATVQSGTAKKSDIHSLLYI